MGYDMAELDELARLSDIHWRYYIADLPSFALSSLL